MKIAYMHKRILSVMILWASFNAVLGQEQFQADWKSLNNYEIPSWYRDAKFGIFIHWGVYSVPAFGSEWYPRNMYDKGSSEYTHHLATYGSQSKFGYKDFIPMFKAEKFDAHQWAVLFKQAGAKYVVPVAEHLVGFAMYNTRLSKWNAFNMGPKRDVIGELAEAVRGENMVFGLSSHRIEHWFFMNTGRGIDSDVNDSAFADFYGPARKEKDSLTTTYMDNWLERCKELVDRYKPQVFWFDWWIEQSAMEPYCRNFAAYYYNQALSWNKGVVINYKNKTFTEYSAVLDLERGRTAGIREFAWQSDDAVGFKSWGYISGEKYKSPQYLVDELIDIVSKNGNLLLNIGPRSDGTIPDEQQKLLLAMGKWLEVNGEAIYGTRPWKIFGEGPTENIAGSFIDGKVKSFKAFDVRFTTRGDTLYAISLAIPTNNDPLVIRNLASNLSGSRNVASVSVVGSSEKLVWSQEDEGLVIRPLKKYPSPWAAVYRITFHG